jgi:hypothetical protein
MVGCTGHRRDNDRYLMALIDLCLYTQRNIANAVKVGNRRAAKFLNNECHYVVC